MVARAKDPEVEDTFQLKPYWHLSPQRQIWICTGIGGCGSIVGDRASHVLWHTRLEDEGVRVNNKLRELEKGLENLSNNPIKVIGSNSEAIDQ